MEISNYVKSAVEANLHKKLKEGGGSLDTLTTAALTSEGNGRLEYVNYLVDSVDGEEMVVVDGSYWRRMGRGNETLQQQPIVDYRVGDEIVNKVINEYHRESAFEDILIVPEEDGESYVLRYVLGRGEESQFNEESVFPRRFYHGTMFLPKDEIGNSSYIRSLFDKKWGLYTAFQDVGSEELETIGFAVGSRRELNPPCVGQEWNFRVKEYRVSGLEDMDVRSWFEGNRITFGDE